MVNSSYSVLETLTVAAIGLCIIFGVLGVLILVTKILASASAFTSKRPSRGIEAQPASPQLVRAKGSSGEIALYDVDDRTAAMLMAIVADELKTPLNELHFHSIREREGAKGADTI